MYKLSGGVRQYWSVFYTQHMCLYAYMNSIEFYLAIGRYSLSCAKEQINWGAVVGDTCSLKVGRHTHQGKILAVGMSGWGRHTFTKCDISS